MIYYNSGNIFELQADALVNPVNCVGVMGKGLALQFKSLFPEVFSAYKAACDQGLVKVGVMHVVETGRFESPFSVINFPTKQHWMDLSRMSFIDAGLLALVDEVERREIGIIGIPQIGCGLGGLDWRDVRPLIVKTFERLPHVDVHLFGPPR